MPETKRTGHAPRTDSEESRDQKAPHLRTLYSIIGPRGLVGITSIAEVAERYSRKGFRVTARTVAIGA